VLAVGVIVSGQPVHGSVIRLFLYVMSTETNTQLFSFTGRGKRFQQYAAVFWLIVQCLPLYSKGPLRSVVTKLFSWSKMARA
jgi:hypothetical protein